MPDRGTGSKKKTTFESGVGRRCPCSAADTFLCLRNNRTRENGNAAYLRQYDLGIPKTCWPK